MTDQTPLEGQMTIFDLMTGPADELQDVPEGFARYIGQCKYCMWYGYGLYDPITRKRRKGTEGQMCQWEGKKNLGCHDRSKWKPGEYAIPGMCANCAWANCFHYQIKSEYEGKDTVKAFKDPVEEPNIYCTREGGSVNRRQPFRDFYEMHFGACLWDRQHEWDVCDAWQSDGWRLERRKDHEE